MSELSGKRESGSVGARREGVWGPLSEALVAKTRGQSAGVSWECGKDHWVLGARSETGQRPLPRTGFPG